MDKVAEFIVILSCGCSYIDATGLEPEIGDLVGCPECEKWEQSIVDVMLVKEVKRNG